MHSKIKVWIIFAMKITIELPENIDKLWDEAKKLAKENGVQIEGDMNKGSFSIKGISAAYTVSGKTLTAIAEKVPFFFFLKMIKKEIEKWFNSIGHA
jgi:hypothetical protein